MRHAAVSRRRRLSTRGTTVLGWFAGLALGGCGGPRFTSQHASSGGVGGTDGSAGGGTAGAAAGSSAAGGALGGSAGSGGGGDAGGLAGTGGMGGSDACRCAAGQYCRAGTCFDCADLSQLDFGPRHEVLNHPSGALRFPRAGDVDGSLFFSLVTPTVSELWYTSDVAKSPGGTLGTSMLARTGLDFFGDPGGLGFDVLFEEMPDGGPRTIRAATFASGVLGSAMAPPAPLAAGTGDTYSVAYARATGRAYFMTTRDGAPALETAVLGTDATDTVDLEIPSAGSTNCPRQGDDATPWITPDGRFLLFSALPVDAACTPSDGTATDLYIALVDSTTGLPRATAVALSAVNVSADGSVETEPSFTSDLCALYFASDGGGAQDHDFRVYRADRR